jgi:hypothetical protein
MLSLSRRYLERRGYGVYRTPAADLAAAATVKESQYYTQWCAPCRLFTPSTGHPDFQAVKKTRLMNFLQQRRIADHTAHSTSPGLKAAVGRCTVTEPQ